MMRIAFLFPGQGAQYPGMGKDFVDGYAAARMVFEEADDILGRNISDIILNGPKDTLTETKNSQTGIYVTSIAFLRVVQELFPSIQPVVCAGLSLGEYTAVTAANFMQFSDCLPLVQHRGEFMNDACESSEGTMAVVLGMSSEDVEQIVREVNLPNDLWVANFNCPGQVVISGTKKGIEAGMALAKAKGVKRVLPLSVHGAFHSGLMLPAQQCLKPYVMEAPIKKSDVKIVMNVPGGEVSDIATVQKNLIDQVTHPVRWEQGMHAIEEMEIDLYIEMGPGKTLAGFNKRIGVQSPTVSIEKVDDLKLLENYG